MRKPRIVRPWPGWSVLSGIAIFLLAGAANGQVINGFVRDAQTGPLSSMVVSAYGADGSLQASATTDINGRYDLNVAPGRYRVLAYDPTGAYATQFSANAPSFEESPETVVAAGQSVTVNFNLIRAGNVTGFVLTSAGVRSGMIVAAYNLAGTRRGFTTTNEGGTYTLVLPPGTYKIVAYDDEALFAPAFFNGRANFADADPVTVTAGNALPSVDLFLQQGARLSGVVTTVGGTPVTNASVLVYSAAGAYVSFGSTDKNGRFTVTVTPGAYRLVAVDNSFLYAAAFLSGATSFDLSPVVTVGTGNVRNDLTFKLERGGRVEGTVVDSSTRAGIASIVVAAYNVDGTLRTSTVTDANGRYVLLLPTGNFIIAAFDPRGAYATQFYTGEDAFARGVAITPVPEQTVTLQPIALPRGGRISGSITDQATGALIGGAIVVAYDDSGNVVASATASPSGSYLLTLPAGTYRLAAFDSALRYAPAFLDGATSFDSSVPLTVADGTQSLMSFALRRATTVSGTVTDSTQHGIGGIQVSALDFNRNRVATGTTRSDGTFQLAVVPGTYKFVAFDPAGRYVTSFFSGSTFDSAAAVDVAATGPPRLTIVLQLASRRRPGPH